MYKLFEIIYNSGEWSCSNYHHYYLAHNMEEVAQNSKVYQTYLEIQKKNGGDLYIFETGISDYCSNIENAKDFNLTLEVEEVKR